MTNAIPGLNCEVAMYGTANIEEAAIGLFEVGEGIVAIIVIAP